MKLCPSYTKLVFFCALLGCGELVHIYQTGQPQTKHLTWCCCCALLGCGELVHIYQIGQPQTTALTLCCCCVYLGCGELVHIYQTGQPQTTALNSMLLLCLSRLWRVSPYLSNRSTSNYSTQLYGSTEGKIKFNILLNIKLKLIFMVCD